MMSDYAQAAGCFVLGSSIGVLFGATIAGARRQIRMRELDIYALHAAILEQAVDAGIAWLERAEPGARRMLEDPSADGSKPAWEFAGERPPPLPPPPRTGFDASKTPTRAIERGKCTCGHTSGMHGPQMPHPCHVCQCQKYLRKPERGADDA